MEDFMNEENELDSTCGISDKEIKRPYIEYADGSREYA